MDKIPQFGSMFVMKISSVRSNQWWFLTCPKVIVYTNRLMDITCRPFHFFINIHIFICVCFPIIAANQDENNFKKGI